MQPKTYATHGEYMYLLYMYDLDSWLSVSVVYVSLAELDCYAFRVGKSAIVVRIYREWRLEGDDTSGCALIYTHVHSDDNQLW